jgi:drug/metabolite transporter (DMT)-like permease
MDALLVLMVLIWAGNFSVVKAVFREIPPLPFNAVRLVVSSAVFVWLLARSTHTGRAGASSLWRPASAGPPRVPGGPRIGAASLTRADWRRVGILGVVGHFCYQLCFVTGLDHTSVANSALIMGCTPVAIALLAAAAGDERVTRPHWIAAVLSIMGLYLVAGRGARLSGESLVGDLLMLAAVGCWAVYSVFARPLLARHSPLIVTSYTMGIGTALFVPVSLPAVLQVDWAAVGAWSWAGTVLSGVLALNVAYLIWYTSVQRIGSARTAMYSNVVPVVAMFFAWAALDESLDAAKVGGAALILSGVFLSRLGREPTTAEPPAEE